MEVLNTTIRDCRQMFENTMEMQAALQEDPHVQNTEAKIREKQLQFDEIIEKAWTLVPM